MEGITDLSLALTAFGFPLIVLAGWVFALVGSLKRTLHILQLEDYEPLRMLKAVLRRPVFLRISWLEVAGVILVIVAYQLWQQGRFTFPESCYYSYHAGSCFFAGLLIWEFGLVAWFAGCIRRSRRIARELQDAKRPLVMTSRARRILLTGIALSLTAVAVCTVIIHFVISTDFWIGLVWDHSFFPRSDHGYYRIINLQGFIYGYWFFLSFFYLAAMFFIERLSPLILTAAVGVLQPLERTIQGRYLRDARGIISEMHPLVVGITGSYGKTGTKELLAAMLGSRFNLLRPPGSFNTLMGVTRVIREQLRPFHECVVVEMGAYRIGSIAKLCRLVEPAHGIVTVIGVQHLERFGSQAVIQRAKGELIRALPSSGIAVLNGDDPLCREIGDRHPGDVVYFSLERPDPDRPTLVITNIRVGLEGSDFDIRYPDGEVQDVHLSLLGRGAVANAAAAATMADRLGIPRREIARTLAAMPHTRHRLEPIRRADGVTIIDDAYNSNPIGAQAALEVLSKATAGRRVLVTPGMVELGALEQQANREFGRQAAAVCDLVVLVGIKRTEPIRQGLTERGFAADDIWIVPSLDEGLERLKGYLKSGDTVLLENDLPDQYVEGSK